MPSPIKIEVLQRRRALLVKKFNAHAATADRHLESYVKLRVANNELAAQISDLDDVLDARLDHKLDVIDSVQLNSGEYQDDFAGRLD